MLFELFQVYETNEIIDLNKLKVKEKIFFYEDIILYEDELADNGVASMSVKIVSANHIYIYYNYITLSTEFRNLFHYEASSITCPLS